MSQKLVEQLSSELKQMKEEGFYKNECPLASHQGAEVLKKEGASVINFCANNYLGLANHPDILESAKKSLDTYGYGMASVRFICGTHHIHHRLEEKLSSWLHQEATQLYGSCFDANGGVFEALLGEGDVIISDSANHASLIDGIRLSKADRLRYPSGDVLALEEQLKKTQSYRHRLICTDGVFSMDGTLAPLPEVVRLAKQYDCLILVDDSHGIGVIGPRGTGTAGYYDRLEEVDIITGTLGKALGGASGGFIASSQIIVDYLRQKARPYLFSNALPPVMAGAALTAIEMVESQPALLEQLHQNMTYLRQGLKQLGFQLKGDKHPIIPIMLKDAKLAQQMAKTLMVQGIYVVGFSYPVVPRGEARIRLQASAAHSQAQCDRALEAFEEVGRALKVI